jgi:hypothetical protein
MIHLDDRQAACELPNGAESSISNRYDTDSEIDCMRAPCGVKLRPKEGTAAVDASTAMWLDRRSVEVNPTHALRTSTVGTASGSLLGRHMDF